MEVDAAPKEQIHVRLLLHVMFPFALDEVSECLVIELVAAIQVQFPQEKGVRFLRDHL